MDNNWQDRAATFAREHNLLHNPDVHALDLLSELGEVAKELLLATEYGTQPAEFRPELSDELGDALYSLCVLATATQVNLEEALTDTLNKYRRRLTKTGSSGSG